MDTPNGQLTAYDVQSAARDVWHYVKNAFFDFLLLMNNARKNKGLSTEFVNTGALLLYICVTSDTQTTFFSNLRSNPPSQSKALHDRLIL